MTELQLTDAILRASGSSIVEGTAVYLEMCIRDSMIIVVSGEKKEVKDNLTLPELIEQENVEMQEYVTVSINEEFVPSDEKETTVLKEGDIVEFLYFMGGAVSYTHLIH